MARLQVTISAMRERLDTRRYYPLLANVPGCCHLSLSPRIPPLPAAASDHRSCVGLSTARSSAHLKETELRFRQIHLDFHTSEFIESVGSNFDPDEFAETLVKANVNSITCFARCHHGWLYFDTKAFPERKHSHLQKELIPRQIQACHQRGIRVPIYLTVQWDHYTAPRHPEWVAQDSG
jgi:hypothetical protein